MQTDTTITSVAAEPLDLPLREPFAIATGSVPVARNVLVRVELAGGKSGLGEAAPFPEVNGETRTAVLDAIGRAGAELTGRDAARWRHLSRQMMESGVAQAALCGLETALLDALARHHGIPLWQFFGGEQTRLCTDMTVTAGNRDHAARAARKIRERGISTIKIKIGALSPALDAERVVAIREAVPEARLLVDANGGYAAAAAIEFADRVRAAGIALDAFEQPVPRDDWQGMATVRTNISVPVFADESARDAVDVARLISEGLVDGINIKIMKSGIVGALSMWELARAHGLQLMIGGMVESILAMSMSASLAAGLGGFRLVDLDTPLFVERHPFSGGYVQNGEVLDLAAIDSGHGVRIR